MIPRIGGNSHLHLWQGGNGGTGGGGGKGGGVQQDVEEVKEGVEEEVGKGKKEGAQRR